MNNLPPPRARLAGCMWLPRIITKARRLQSGTLASEYEARFCHPTGVDAQFLKFFGLSKEDILAASRESDDQVTSWFAGITSKHPSMISEWNHLAENLGRPGFPMAERLPVALSTTYNHLDPATINSVFEAIEADESCAKGRDQAGGAP